MSRATGVKAFFIRQKIKGNRKKRQPRLQPAQSISSIAIVTAQPFSKAENQILAKVFPNAKATYLGISAKSTAVNSSDSFNGLSTKDFNLTGVLNNEKISSIINKSYQLVLDLSDDHLVNRYLLSALNGDLFVGKASAQKQNWYDLMINHAETTVDFISQTALNINKLTGNEH